MTQLLNQDPNSFDFETNPQAALRIKWFHFLLNLPNDKKSPAPNNFRLIPYFILQAFLQNFPESASLVNQSLEAGHLKITPTFVPLCPPLCSLESHLQNQILVTRLKPRLMQALQRQLPENCFQVPTEAATTVTALPEGCFSARIHLKQLNAECQHLLNRYLNPLNALLSFYSQKSLANLLRYLQAHLLKCQNNAVLTGCCNDAVASEGEHLLGQVRTSETALLQDIFSLAAPLDSENSTEVTLFNPSPFSRRSVALIGLPQAFGNDFHICDQQGKALAWQIISAKSTPAWCANEKYQEDGIQLLVDTPEIPALGFSPISIKTSASNVHFRTGLKTGYYFLENDFVRVAVANNGSLSVYDKPTAQTYEPLNVFEDSGDVGTTASFKPPAINNVILSPKFTPRLSLAETGPLRGAIRIRYRMPLPESATPDRTGRSHKTAVLRIWSTVYLGYDSPVLFFDTRVVNTIQDHRLRVRFTSGTDTRVSRVGSWQNEAVREHAGFSGKRLPGEKPDANWPLTNWVTVTDPSKTRGFTLFTRGLPGYQLLLDPARTLTLTLLRAVGTWQNATDEAELKRDGQAPAAQCLREYHFQYALLPVSKTEAQNGWDPVNAFEEFLSPLLVLPGKLQNQFSTGKAPFAITPKSFLLSALRESMDGQGFVLSLMNPHPQEQSGEIRFGVPLMAVYQIDASETNLTPIPLENDHLINIQMPANTALSIKFITKNGCPGIRASTQRLVIFK